MKSILNYLTEKRGDLNTGFWEPFEDEDTGEVINIWRSYPSEEMIKLQKEIDEEEEKIYDTIRDMIKKLDAKYKTVWDEEWSLRDEISGYEDDIRQLKHRRRDLLSDMEQEVGHLMHAGKDAEAEEKGNEYGGELNDIEEEIDNLLEKISDLEDKLDEVLAKSDKYDDEREAIEKKEEALKSKLQPKKDKLEQLRDEQYEKDNADE